MVRGTSEWNPFTKSGERTDLQDKTRKIVDIWKKGNTFPEGCVAQLAARIAAASTPAGRSPAGPTLDPKAGKYLSHSPIQRLLCEAEWTQRTRTPPITHPSDRRTTEHADGQLLHGRLPPTYPQAPIYIYAVVDARRHASLLWLWPSQVP